MKNTSRREFISRTRGAALGLLTVRSHGIGATAARDNITDDLAARIRRDRKIDAHAHLGFGPSLRLPVEQLLRAADSLGIERLAVSVPSGPLPTLVSEANDVVLRAMKSHPDRIIGQCCVNPLYAREALEETKRCLGEGMLGLGELYTYARASDPAFFPLIEYCITQNAPLMWHARADLGMVRRNFADAKGSTTTTAQDFVELAQRYPEALLIHGHIGGGGDWEYMCKTLHAAPTVFLDTSGSVSEPGMIDFAVNTLGPQRLLFGSDMNFEVAVGKLLSAHLSAIDREMIFSGNFNRILKRRGLHAN